MGPGLLRAGGDEGQGQIGEQDVGQTVRGHGVGAGHRPVSCRQPRGEDGVEQVVGQPGAVRQLIHAACLGLHGAPEGEGALVGDGGQEPLIRSAVAAGGLFQLPADDPGGPLGQLLLHRRGSQQLAHVPAQLPRRAQAAVDPFVVALVFGEGGLKLLLQGLEAGAVVEAAQVYVTVHRAGAVGFDYVGGGYVSTLWGTSCLIMIGVTAHKKAAGNLPSNHVPDLS